jgi:hypothetical protein
MPSTTGSWKSSRKKVVFNGPQSGFHATGPSQSDTKMPQNDDVENFYLIYNEKIGVVTFLGLLSAPI